MGKDVRFRTPADARAMGIEAVYQDLAIVDQLSLWRNFFLGKEIVRKVGPLRILQREQMRQEAQKAITELGLTRIRSADEPVWSMSGGERQSVAITRAIHFGARLLLLDEPTAALSVRETRNVLESIGRAREQKLGVLYIDHNMSHVLPGRRPHRAARARPRRARHRPRRGRASRSCRTSSPGATTYQCELDKTWRRRPRLQRQ